MGTWICDSLGLGDPRFLMEKRFALGAKPTHAMRRHEWGTPEYGFQVMYGAPGRTWAQQKGSFEKILSGMIFHFV
jgi:hypothetical protein